MKTRLTAVFLCLLALSGCTHAMNPLPAVPTPAANIPAATPTPSASASAPAAASEISVHFIDVGHGDCILIQAGNENMLIDAGNPQSSGEVIEYLRYCGVEKLDKVLVTHIHPDHIGGLTDIVEAIPIGELIISSTDSKNAACAAALDAVREKNLAVLRPYVGLRLSLADAVLTVLAPKGDTYKDLNNTSVVTRLTFGETSFLLTGDASTVSEREMLANEPVMPLQSTLLKCGHHGGESSCKQEFLDAVRPQYAVIFCAKSDKKQFPCPEVLSRLTSLGAVIFRTDWAGTLVVRSDGEKLRFE